eukprot:3939403-Rhodomonas_salina.1
MLLYQCLRFSCTSVFGYFCTGISDTAVLKGSFVGSGGGPYSRARAHHGHLHPNRRRRHGHDLRELASFFPFPVLFLVFVFLVLFFPSGVDGCRRGLADGIKGAADAEHDADADDDAAAAADADADDDDDAADDADAGADE